MAGETTNFEQEEPEENLEKELLDERKNQEENQQKEMLINSLYQKLNSGSVLKNEELNLLKENVPEENFKQLETYHNLLKDLYNKEQEGILNEQEKNHLKQITESQIQEQLKNQNLTLNEHNKARFNLTKQNVLQKGGSEIIHFSDTESDSQDLEGRIYKILQDKEKHKFEKKDIVVHTGDILNSFFDAEKFGQIEMFLPENIIEQGQLEGKLKEEFLEDYQYILKRIGITENDIRTKNFSSDQEFNILSEAMLGYVDSSGLSISEKIEFDQIHSRFINALRIGVDNWATNEYSQIKEVFEKYGLTPENFVLIGGNHDVVNPMKKILGEYMPNEGEIREINGEKFGYVYGDSTGSLMRGHFNDLFGSQDLSEKSVQENYYFNSKGFQTIKNGLESSLGIKQTNEEIRDLIKADVNKSKYGLNDNLVRDYENNFIGGEVQKTIKDRLAQIKKNVNKVSGADHLIMHGHMNDPQYAGIGEKAVFRKIQQMQKDENKKYNVMHGHIGSNTTGTYGGVLQFNPGTNKSYNYGSYLFDKDKEFVGAFTTQPDKLKEGVEFLDMYQGPNDLSGSRARGGNSY